MDYVTAKEKSEEWGISLRRVQAFCEEDRIEGVSRMGKIWVIPKDAEKPSDLRYSKNRQKNDLIQRLRGTLKTQVFAGMLGSKEYDMYSYDAQSNSICITSTNKIYFYGDNFRLLTSAIKRIKDTYGSCRFSFIDLKVKMFICRQYSVAQCTTFDAYYLERYKDIEITKDTFQVSRSDIPLICGCSMYRDDKLYTRIENNVLNRFSAGIYIKNNLVSWALIYANNTIGPVHTIDEYRNNGYASKVVASVSCELFSQGYYPIATIDPNNNLSKKLFEALKFEMFDSYYWISIT